MDRRKVLEPFQAMRLEPALVLVELGALHSPAAAGFRDIAQGLGQLEGGQALAGDFLFGSGHDILLSGLENSASATPALRFTALLLTINHRSERRLVIQLRTLIFLLKRNIQISMKKSSLTNSGKN